jgi:membrane-associated protein
MPYPRRTRARPAQPMELLAFFWDLVVHLDRHLAALLQQYGPWIYALLS